MPTLTRKTLLLSTTTVLLAAAAHAALGGTDGVVIPFTGRLELNGALASGAADFQFKVMVNDSTATVCDTKTVVNVPITRGEFALRIPRVLEACVKGQDVHLIVAVRQNGGAFIELGKQRVTPVLSAMTSGVGDFAVTGALSAASAAVTGQVTAKSLVVSDPFSLLVAEFDGIAIGGDTIKATGGATNQDIILVPKGNGIVQVTGGLRVAGVVTGNGSVTVNDDLDVAGRITSQCRTGFTAIDGGRICISTLMQPRNGNVVGGPVPMQDRVDAAIRMCRRERAHVCTHTDIQQVCGNFLEVGGLNPYSEIGTNGLWYGDLAGNDLFQVNSNPFTLCADNVDNQSLGAVSGITAAALYRCCY